jgi:probable 2-oxoglutarate dehydrogenase E1 component DHKTD1
MLLPHGMDGAGPEHSSCRIERFLQLTDSNESNSIDGDFNNCQVIYPTTPAQYFHLLRRQVLRNFRKPLVVVAPKILLRLSAATSSVAEMGPSTFFNPVIGDTTCSDNPKRVNKLVFVAGKHYYALHERRHELNATNVAIIRVESLCPFPVNEIEKEIAKYPNASKLIWSQEEHRNQGAWTFIRPRFESLLGRQIEYVGRDTLGAPAVGSTQVHKKEEAKILEETFS